MPQHWLGLIGGYHFSVTFWRLGLKADTAAPPEWSFPCILVDCNPLASLLCQDEHKCIRQEKNKLRLAGFFHFNWRECTSKTKKILDKAVHDGAITLWVLTTMHDTGYNVFATMRQETKWRESKKSTAHYERWVLHSPSNLFTHYLTSSKINKYTLRFWHLHCCYCFSYAALTSKCKKPVCKCLPLWFHWGKAVLQHFNTSGLMMGLPHSPGPWSIPITFTRTSVHIW